MSECELVLAAWGCLQEVTASKGRRIAELEAELESKSREISNKDRRIGCLEAQAQQLHRQIEELQTPHAVLPQLDSLVEPLQGIAALRPGQRIKFPVWGLRWTQKTFASQQSRTGSCTLHSATQAECSRSIQSLPPSDTSARGCYHGQDI